MQLTDCARRLSREHGVAIDTAMISDVPGYTWGIGPGHRPERHQVLLDRAEPHSTASVGRWTSGAIGRSGGSRRRARNGALLDGRQGLLVVPRRAAIGILKATAAGAVPRVPGRSWTRQRYPYDMVQIRYSIGGDNGPPDPDLPEFVKAVERQVRRGRRW